MITVSAAKKLLAASRLRAHPAYYAARDLDQAAHGTHDELITKLLVKALTLKPPIDWPMMWEIANDAWKFLGKNAGPVWTAYEKIEADDVLRLEWYARIAKQGGAFARPWLEKGRARRLRPDRTNRKLSNQVYEAKLDTLLGKAVAPAKKLTPTDPKKGYRFERYIAAVTKAAVVATKKLKLPEPISRIHLAGRDDDITVHFISFEWADRQVVGRLANVPTKIPRTGDSPDPVMSAFVERHGLTGDPSAPSWADLYEAPHAILIEELLHVVEVVQATVARAPRIQLCVGDGDNQWKRSSGFARKAKAHLARLEPGIREDLLRLCFETAAKRKAYGG